MEKPRHLFCKAAFWAAIIGFGAAADAATTAGSAHGGTGPAQARQQLEGLRARVGELTTRLVDELKHRDQLAAHLRDADLTIPDKRKALDAVRMERQAADKRLGQLTQEQTRTHKNLDQQRLELARQLKASYMLGRGQQLKLLLNQEDPARTGRMLTYYGYFGRRLLKQIESIQQDLARLDTLRHELASETDRLAVLDQALVRELQNLLDARKARGAALAALNQRVLNANQQIARMNQEMAALDSLVANLNRVSPDFNLGPKKPFAQMKGGLPWPVAGRSSSGNRNAVHWSGVQIEAARGAKVRAPYFGRVVYADWLQGLGLLLIIEHGAGYLTLYGHAEVLYKSVGDAVAPGDIIAGLSETDSTPLYFEIRQGKTPMDPRRWLKASR